MKHLKLWENYKDSDLNSKYIELAHILQSEVFDDYNIKSKTTEILDDDEPIFHKFWAYRVKSNWRKIVANLDEVERYNLKIDYVNAFGIPEGQLDEITEKVKSLKGLVEDFLSMKLKVSNEYWRDGIYDLIIELVNEEETPEELF